MSNIIINNTINNTQVMDNGDLARGEAGADEAVRLNSAIYAMKILQKSMAGEAEKKGLASPGDVAALVRELRGAED